MLRPWVASGGAMQLCWDAVTAVKSAQLRAALVITFNAAASTEVYTLALHAALPIPVLESESRSDQLMPEMESEAKSSQLTPPSERS